MSHGNGVLDSVREKPADLDSAGFRIITTVTFLTYPRKDVKSLKSNQRKYLKGNISVQFINLSTVCTEAKKLDLASN